MMNDLRDRLMKYVCVGFYSTFQIQHAQYGHGSTRKVEQMLLSGCLTSTIIAIDLEELLRFADILNFES